MKIDSTPNRQNGEEINRVNGSSLGTKNDPGIDLSGIKVQWSDEDSRMTQMGGLAYFTKFLEVPWVLDVDVTIKQLYGKQEGAVLGYNPVKPGRPSHAYHSFWVGHLRLTAIRQR